MRFEHMTLTEQRDWALSQLHDAQVEIANLKNDATLRSNLSFQADLQQRFHLTPQRAGIVCMLHAARGRSLSYDYIHENLPDVGNRVERLDTIKDLVKVQVCHIRRRMGRDSIICIWGVGYAMSPECLAMLDEMQATLSPKPSLALVP